MLYLFCASIGMIAGLLLTRQPRCLLLEKTKLLWLLLLAVLLSSLPHFLAVVNPEILWQDNNWLLKMLIVIAHSVLLVFIVVNLFSRIIKAVYNWRALVRTGADNMKAPNGKEVAEASKENNGKKTNKQRYSQLFTAISASLLVIAYIGLGIGLGTHLSVLIQNNGIMPISADYLNDISDPVIAEGIRNNALYFKRIIDDQTIMPQFGQIIRAEKLSFLLPDGFVYISVSELIIALSLMFVILLTIVVDTSMRPLSIRRNK
ncbi:MAG: hypothetical protein PWP10_4071 [Clostridiales bacterium]|nr:hypothetical protein [Clostridiales bacterium]